MQVLISFFRGWGQKSMKNCPKWSWAVEKVSLVKFSPSRLMGAHSMARRSPSNQMRAIVGSTVCSSCIISSIMGPSMLPQFPTSGESGKGRPTSIAIGSGSRLFLRSSSLFEEPTLSMRQATSYLCRTLSYL